MDRQNGERPPLALTIGTLRMLMRWAGLVGTVFLSSSLG